jgi:hypothetical protein
MFQSLGIRILIAVPLILLVVGLVYRCVLLPRHLRWGATESEARAAMPGDEIALGSNMSSTRAVTIRASAAQIWPWLAQLGQGRGGMYSYEWLENLAGCDFLNADRILPEFQNLQVGDLIHMGPEGYPFYSVVQVEPNRALVLRPHAPKTKAPSRAAWSFLLTEQGDGTTRLISRQQMVYEPSVASFIGWKVITEPLSFVMEHKMLRTLKALAESVAAR